MIYHSEEGPGDFEITIRWEPVAGADRYEIQQKVPGLLAWIDLPRGGLTVRLGPDHAVAGGLPYGAIYVHRVRALNNQGESEWSDPHNTLVAPAFNAGHQEDHVVQYQMGFAPTSWTHDPGTGTPLGMLSSATSSGATAWTNAIGGHSGLGSTGLRLCLDPCPSGVNDDTHTVTIRFATLKTAESSDIYDENPNHGCGAAIACVKGQAAGRHISSGTIVIEEPAFYYKKGKSNAAFWTLDERKSNNPVRDEDNNIIGRYRYLIATMTHELGHALGLPDFYKYDSLKSYRAVMTTSELYFVPQPEDLRHLWKIYRGHSRIPH